MSRIIALGVFIFVFISFASAVDISQLRGNKFLKPGNIIYSTATDGRHVWFGTSTGLVEFDNKTNLWQVFNEKISIKDIHTLCWNGDRLFIAAFDKDGCELVCYNPEDKKFQRLTGWSIGKEDLEIWNITADKSNVFLATGKGISCLDLKTMQWQYFRLGKRVLSFLRNGNDIYFGTEAGVWTLAGERINKIKSPDALSSSRVYCLVLIDGKIWAGTSAGAFSSELPLSDSWAHFNTDNSGNCCNSVYAIQKDGECIWFAGEGGISRFNPALRTWFYCTAGCGLYWDQKTISSFCDDGTTLWFGSSVGGIFSIKKQEHYPDYMNTWILAGPFEYDNSEKGFQESFISEHIDNKNVIDLIKQNNKVKVMEKTFYSFVDLGKTFNVKKNALCYAMSSMESMEEKEVRMTIDCNDAVKLWINQELVFNNYKDYVSGFSRHTEKTIKVKLKKGSNDILLKIANHKSDGRLWGFFLSIPNCFK